MTRRHMGWLCLVLTATVLGALPASAHAAPSGWWVKRVMRQTATARFTGIPRVTGKFVAAITATDTVHGSQLWVWRLGASAPSLVATAAQIENTDHWGASGSRLAWRSYNGSTKRVMTWRLGDSRPRALASGSPLDIDVSGDRVVWSDYDTSRICTWRLGDSAPTTLSSQPYGFGPGNPSVSGDRIVYQQYDGSAIQLILWTAGWAQPIALTSDSADHLEPVIEGSRVSWASYRWGEDTWVRTLSLGSTATTLGTVSWYPHLCASGDRLAWRPYEPSMNNQLVTWKAPETSPTTVTVPADHVSDYPDQPSLSGDRLVWIDWGSHLSQIKTMVVGEALPSVLATGDYTLHSPKVSGDTVVWMNEQPGAEGIWVAHKQAAPRLSVPKTSVRKPAHGTYFRFTGSIGSADPAGGRISLTLRRYYSKKWHTVKTYKATLGAGKKSYSRKVRLSKAGKYSVRATHAADFAHTAQMTSYRSFTVK